MTAVVDVDGVRLTVPSGWWIWKYDESAFHRKQFQSFAGGSKAMDAVALGGGVLWLVEIKDYRRSRRSKPSTVFAEVAAKVKATLAGLAAARVRANNPAERAFAEQALVCQDIRIALQLAQPTSPSRLFPYVVDPVDARIQLRREVRAVDAHPECIVGDINSPRLPWTTHF